MPVILKSCFLTTCYNLFLAGALYVTKLMSETHGKPCEGPVFRNPLLNSWYLNRASSPLTFKSSTSLESPLSSNPTTPSGSFLDIGTVSLALGDWVKANHSSNISGSSIHFNGGGNLSALFHQQFDERSTSPIDQGEGFAEITSDDGVNVFDEILMLFRQRRLSLATLFLNALTPGHVTFRSSFTQQ